MHRLLQYCCDCIATRQQLSVGRFGPFCFDTSPPPNLTLPPGRRVEQVVKRYERGEVEHVDWLDRLAQRSIAELRAREAAQRQDDAELAAAGEGAGPLPSGGTSPAVAPGGIQLLVELPSFPRTVIYQQAAVGQHGGAPAGGLAGAGTATADAISTPLPGTSGAAGGAGGTGGSSTLILLHDAEVGRENPAEAKAAKLARSLTRGLVDKKLKPDTEERRRIEAVLDYPPNRCCWLVDWWAVEGFECVAHLAQASGASLCVGLWAQRSAAVGPQRWAGLLLQRGRCFARLTMRAALLQWQQFQGTEQVYTAPPCPPA